MKQPYPILEFDPAPTALINPKTTRAGNEIPEACVLCFFQELFARYSQEGRLGKIGQIKSALGAHPIFRLEQEGAALTVMHPGIGAPLAAAILEELIGLGAKKVIVCGGAGVLDGGIPRGRPLIATAALRDEGTSYHYLPPAREVAVGAGAIAAIEQTLKKHRLAYELVKAWTTDGYYRETREKIRRRKAEGCLAVDMEAAALLAVAAFRRVPLGVLFYAGDDVSGAVHDARRWTRQFATREKFFQLAVESCLALSADCR